MEPLAYRMRPKVIDDIVGQDHILGKDKILRKMIENDNLSSIILYGSPGIGKTTIASVIANMTKKKFVSINATVSGKKDLEKICEEENIILFIDEIHRFNKAQQDYLLPFVESGKVVLIGATTENPYFEVNKAILSRSMVFKLNDLSYIDIRKLLDRANEYNINDEVLDYIAKMSNGDARYALQILEYAYINGDNSIDAVKDIIQKPHINYDKDNIHYDVVAAFTKSLQGSDVDAVLYYLAMMMEGGEDIKFIARRLMIHASEDIGNADPMALVIATSCTEAIERVGLPEAETILAHTSIYLTMAPKSDAVYKSYQRAKSYIREHPSNSIPEYLKNTSYDKYKYKNPHNYDNHYIKQRYLPDHVTSTFYISNSMGYERQQDNYRSKITDKKA